MKALQFSVTTPQFVALKALGLLNKGLYYKGPFATVKIADIPEPERPSSEWVKVKTRMCGFCGSDLSLIFLKDSPTASPFTSFPCTLGHEVCGEAVEIGSDVESVKKGDLVTISPQLGCAARGIAAVCGACASGRPGSCENVAEGTLSPGMFTGICQDVGGGFAPYFVAHKSQLFKLPAGFPPEAGAMIEPLAVALQAVLDNRPQTGDKVLVVGGGVIGNLIVQSIRALDIDCDITVSEPSPFHADLARKAGADHLVAGSDILDQTVEITGAKKYKPMLGGDILMGGYSRIFDVVGNSQTLNTSLRCLGVGGVLSVVGIGHDVKLDPTPLWLKLQTIKGVYANGENNIDGKTIPAFRTAIDFVQSNKVHLKQMVTHKFSIGNFNEMVETNLAKVRHQAVKTMMTFA